MREIFGKNLKRIRNEHGETMAQLAKALGYSLQYINKIESGKANFTAEVVERVCEHYNIAPQELFIRPGDKLVPASKFFEYFPPDLREWVMSLEKMPYVILAKEADENNLSVRALEGIIKSIADARNRK